MSDCEAFKFIVARRVVRLAYRWVRRHSFVVTGVEEDGVREIDHRGEFLCGARGAGAALVKAGRCRGRGGGTYM